MTLWRNLSRAYTHTHSRTKCNSILTLWWPMPMLYCAAAIATRCASYASNSTFRGNVKRTDQSIWMDDIVMGYRLLSMSVPTSIYNISSPYQTHINLKFRFSMVFFLSVCLFVWCLQTRTPHLADWRTMRYRTRRFWTSHSNHRLPYMHSTALWAIIWDCTHWDIRGEAPLASGIWQWKLYVL